jgi:hypothetical protein
VIRFTAICGLLFIGGEVFWIELLTWVTTGHWHHWR